MGWGRKSKSSSSASSVTSSRLSRNSRSGSLHSDASSSVAEDDGKAHIAVCARIRPMAVKVQRQGFFENKSSAKPERSLQPPSGLKAPTPSKPSFFKRVTRKAPLPSKGDKSKSSSSASAASNDFVAWDVNAEGDTASQSSKSNLIQGRTHAYTLDRVYGPTSTTRDIYDNTIHQLIKDAMEGYHSSILSYGQTSTGKTFTMSGTTESPGLIPLSINDCFRYLNEISEQREYLIRLSYLEVYKEHIRDLLASTPQPIRLFENKTDGLIIRGLKEEVVTEPSQVFRLLKEGEARRQVSATSMNQHSSRSHTLVRLWIESHSAGSASRVSSLTMVDLAGSESVRLNGTARREEGQYINKSLMTLGQVVLSLSDGAKGHIPYRDSKLTRLLQPSLSGNARMVLLCCIHPVASHLEESHNTFKFATRAKRIKQKAVINVTADDKTLLQTYREEIDDLKHQLMEAKEQQKLLEERANASSSVSSVASDNLRDAELEATGEISELVEAIKSMERLILKSRPGALGDAADANGSKTRLPQRMDSDINLLANDDSERNHNASGHDPNGGLGTSGGKRVEEKSDDLLDDLLADGDVPQTTTPSQKDDELSKELNRIRGLLGTVLQRRGVASNGPATAGTPTNGANGHQRTDADATPMALQNKFDAEAAKAGTGDGVESEEVQTLRQQLIEQEATTNLSKADSTFLQAQLKEKDQLLEEVSKILEALEQRQTVLERENMKLRQEVTRMKQMNHTRILDI